MTSIRSYLAKGPLLKAKSVTPRDLRLEQYIEVLARNIPELLARAAEEYKDVCDWIERIYMMNHATRNGSETENTASVIHRVGQDSTASAFVPIIARSETLPVRMLECHNSVYSPFREPEWNEAASEFLYMRSHICMGVHAPRVRSDN